MSGYTQLPGLAHVYLQDSYVLGIVETPARLTFRLDAVLTPQHCAYHPPSPGDHHCYALAELTFIDATRIEWITRTGRRYTDATGTEDLGNIDILAVDGDTFLVEGDWGRVRLVAAPPTFKLIGSQDRGAAAPTRDDHPV